MRYSKLGYFFRLMSNLVDVEGHLHFWETRMRRGQHLHFLLTNMGPIAFVQEIKQRVFRLSDLTAADQIEQKV
jgi:hypothetical protein